MVTLKWIITLADTKNMSKESQLAVDGVFVEMGYIAKTDFVENLIPLNRNNEIIVDKYYATSKQGIFAAGDVTDVPYKQAVISAGQGSIAALSDVFYLYNLGNYTGAKYFLDRVLAIDSHDIKALTNMGSILDNSPA
jgi:alkyl hydroperoxide reductase subunit AhpF